MVDVVGAVVRVVDALPPERQLVVLALLGPLLLHARQPRVQPVRRTRVVVDEVRLTLQVEVEGRDVRYSVISSLAGHKLLHNA